jgi:hypothetical protein
LSGIGIIFPSKKTVEYFGGYTGYQHFVNLGPGVTFKIKCCKLTYTVSFQKRDLQLKLIFGKKVLTDNNNFTKCIENFEKINFRQR